MPQPWSFPFCPEPPGWTLDWAGIEAAFPPVAAMRGCPQDPELHAEGDVLTHTRLVCEALAGSDRWRALGAEPRAIVFAAALLHDVAKPACTRMEDGRLRSPKHAVRGASIARTILWRGLPFGSDLQTPLAVRESIVALVRLHSLPLHIFEKADPRRSVIEASQTVRCDWLALLAAADILGRECPDRAKLLDQVELFTAFADEQRCLTRPRSFPSDHSRFAYFQGRSDDPNRHVHDDTRLAAVLLSGLPGAGKDTWLQEQLPLLPIVSLDVIRRRLKVSPEGNQGTVVTAAREQAREYLRQQQPFAWNATNTTRTTRAEVIRLLAGYHARIRLVYLEPAWEDLILRNRRRAAAVPHAVIERLADRLEVPTLTEAHQVEWHPG